MVPHLINSHNNPDRLGWLRSQFLLEREHLRHETVSYWPLWGSALGTGMISGTEVGILGMKTQECEGLSFAPGHPTCPCVTQPSQGFTFPTLEFHCHWLFFLPGNEAKPGGLINPSRCWAAVIGSRRKPFSSCAPKGAWREPMRRWNTQPSVC